jgi:protein O-mannosyl-transferase
MTPGAVTVPAAVCPVPQPGIAAQPSARAGIAAAPAAARVTSRVAVLLVALAILPYLNALRNDFTFDDIRRIVENPIVTARVDLMQVFATSLPPGDQYRPLTVVTLVLNQRLAPGNPVGFHLVNILLHAGVTVLVFALGVRLFGSVRVGMIAAALFAVHPIHAEAVTNIMGREELLAALFGLLALLAAASAEKASSPARRRTYEFASLGWFVLALLSKESGATVLPLIVLVRVVLRGKGLRAGLWRELRRLDWLPYALCAAAFVYVRFLVVGSLGATTVTPLDNALAFVPWAVRVRTALGVLWDYFGLLVMPIVLAADYSTPQVPLSRSWGDPRCLAGAALIVAALVVLARNRRPAVTLAAVFPLVALSLTANLLFPIGTVKAERLLYFPSVGWVLLLAYGCERLLAAPRYRRAAVALLLVVLAAYGGRTWVRNRDWRSNATLFRSMGRAAPNSAKSLYLSGLAALQRGDPGGAAAAFQRALRLFRWEGGEPAAVGLGVIDEQHGQMERAVHWYEAALTINPGSEDAHRDLCHALLVMRRFREAALACRGGLRYRPADAGLLKNLGYALLGGGQHEQGLAVLHEALRLEGNDIVLRAHLARWTTPAGRPTGERTLP